MDATTVRRAPGFPALTRGSTPADKGWYLCSVDAIPATGPFPAVWVSDVDATDPDAGIHCGLIGGELTHAATKAVGWVRKIV